MGPHKTKTFPYSKGLHHTSHTIIRVKRHPTQQEAIFISYTSDRELVPRMYKEDKKLDIKQSK